MTLISIAYELLRPSVLTEIFFSDLNKVVLLSWYLTNTLFVYLFLVYE